jgi:ABC-type Fe3+-hydroxamate transport system substrate-binding protein
MTGGGAKRVVSLVPSDTFSVARLGALDRLVGRTRYCVEPPEVSSIPSVGGTKELLVDKVIALAPDLVLANREKNGQQDITLLQRAGLNVLLDFPRTVVEALDQLHVMARLLDIDPSGCDTLVRADRMRVLASSSRLASNAPRCFVAIWREPWMTVNDDTYIGSVLRLLGLRNVFGAWPSRDDAGRDTRYPEVTLEDIVEQRPEVVLLPDEPYPFGPRHVAQLTELCLPAAREGRVLPIDGKDLCWHGAWALDGIPRLQAHLGAG